MKYLITIGMEIHAELTTQTKMFCSCKNSSFQEEPNTNICPICLGLPGTLPTLNKKAIEYTLQLGADVGATIAELTKWDRKNYFYPDLPKGYQISQFDLPLLIGGAIEFIDANNTIKKINLTRIHLEEDTAKSIHDKSNGNSLIDFNRASAPLLELVSEPELDNARDAKLFCETYQLMLRRRGIASADMEKGEMRCEANISVRPENQKEYGTKVEVKNLNSFKSVEKAIEFEINRQIKAIEAGEQIIQETRGWDEDRQKTFVQRKKETSADYRYFPEPDLPPVTPGSVWNLSQELKSALPYPYLVTNNLVENYGMQKQVAKIVSENLNIFAYWTNLINEIPKANQLQKKSLANAMKLYTNQEITKNLAPNQLLELNSLLETGKITQSQIKEIVEHCIKNSQNPMEVITILGIGTEDNNIEDTIKKVINDNPDAIAKIKSGDQGVIGFLIGQVMQATQGKANPKIARELILKKIQ